VLSALIPTTGAPVSRSGVLAFPPIASPPVTTDPELAEVIWDLEPLVDGEGEAGVMSRLEEAVRRAGALRDRYAGTLEEIDAEGFARLMDELGTLHELAGGAAAFAMLHFAADTSDQARGALVQRVRERGAEIETALLFFDLEWAELPDERAEELLGGPGLERARHHLRTARRYRPYLLSEPEERILAEKDVTSSSAWSRLFAEHTSAIEVELPGGDGAAPEHTPLDVALGRLSSPDREVRRTAADAATAALEPGMRTRAYILNTLVHDKAVEDRLRGYPHWLAARNLANEVSDDSVRALVEAVRSRYDLPQRWYALKARLLGLDRLADYDRSAALRGGEEKIAWGDARETVLESFAPFSGELERLARRFFAERWIDAPARPGKRGGAFCAATVPSVHPYVLLNFDGRRRDVLTLAHELGHGLHFALAGPRGVFEFHTPLTVAETASVFAEELVLARLLDRSPEPEERLALLAESVERAVATVFRQIAMHIFEEAVHRERREQGELSVPRLGELWAATQEEMLGDAVEVTEGYRGWWSYIPHFVNSPGYVYAYAYGLLLALSVYERYLQEGPDFAPRYLEMLGAGGSRSPEELGRIVGIDLEDPGFWASGLELVERTLEQAEDAAHAAGKV
jgi:oligoendopeptidase F